MKRRKGKWKAEAPHEAEAKRELPRFARAYIRAGAKVGGKSASESKLHEFRLVTKHFRYLLEIFEPVYGSKLKPYFDTLRRVQKILGELNDYAVTREMMKKERGPDRDLLLEYLERQQKRELRKFVRYWQAHFDSDEKKRAWIDGLR